jgi:fructose-1-phosphate kinase PfkB-like protein
LNINLSNEKSKLDFLKYLYQNKIHLSFLTDGSNPTYAAKFDFFYKIENPLINKIDETGSGDAFVAGIAYGLEQSYVFEDFVKIGTALGAFNAVNWDICNVNLNQAESLYDLIKISTIGKKMKIIDDSPSV